MHIRIYTIFYCAILFGFATAAQKKSPDQKQNDLQFLENSDLEGSGIGGEVSQDLDSSGSGIGPDDEDGREDITPPYQKPVTQPPVKKTQEIEIEKVTAPPPATEDNSVIMNPKPEERPTSFFAQPGILAAIILGAVVGLLCAILVVMFIVYRMRKKDEGSYTLGEPKQSPNTNSYSRGTNKEFFA